MNAPGSARFTGQRPFSDVKAGKARLARCGRPRPGAAVIICLAVRRSSPSSGAVPTGRTAEARRRQGHRAVNPRAPVRPLLQASEHGQAPRSSRTADVARGNGKSGSVGDRRHEAGQTISPSNERSTVPGGEDRGIAHPGVGRSWLCDLSPPHGTGQRRVGVTPSDARGLVRTPSSAKGWVLPMLAREGELRVAPVPRNRAFLSGRPCPARKTAPEGVDAGTPPARPPGQRERSRS